MNTNNIYVLLTQYGDEPVQPWVYSSRDAAERAILEIAEREHGMFATDLAKPPRAIPDCVAMLQRCCSYGSVRLVQAELNVDPGDYPEPVDLYPPSASAELTPHKGASA